ncbi:MAG: TolC family protein [Spirosomataceae bacterium]
MKNRFSKLFILFLATSGALQAQELLTLDKAINLSLEQSYGIQIAKMQQQAADIQVFKGNAGMMPRVDWNANLGTALNQVNQKLANGTDINRFGRSITPNSNVVMSWVLYDGKRMYATLDRLKNQSQLSQVQTKMMIENTVLAVMRAYYEVMRQKETVKFLETGIKYYDERLKITEERWQVGKGSKLDYLQSKTDLTTQQTEMVRAKNALKNAKIALNDAMNRTSEADFEVQDAISTMFEPSISELQSKARTNNVNIQLLRKSTDISLNQEREAQAQKLPRITLNSSLGYNLNATNAGLFLYNQTVGLNTGIAATWNIFNGEIIRRQIQTAKINTDILQKQQLDLAQQLDFELVRAYNQYQADKELLVLEEENTKIVEENLQISLEKFKLGGSTILELNDAQRRFDTSLNRLVNARFNVKISELEMMRLSGELVK